MDEEFKVLELNNTWTLVPHSPSQKLIDTKWVYKIKQKSFGNIKRYKARLVVKGYLQTLGLNYGETFSSVIKPSSIHIVLVLAQTWNWLIKQLDANNAFLHGTLYDEVFISQPVGYINTSLPNHVC